MYKGSGNKQRGYGEGKKLGTGKWEFINGMWVCRSNIKVKKDAPTHKDIQKDVLKIGKEVCKMTQMGERHKHKELEKDVNKILYKKPKSDLPDKIAKDVVERLKSENHRR